MNDLDLVTPGLTQLSTPNHENCWWTSFEKKVLLLKTQLHNVNKIGCKGRGIRYDDVITCRQLLCLPSFKKCVTEPNFMCCIEREIIYTVEEEEPLAYFILDGRFLFFGTNNKVFNIFESEKKNSLKWTLILISRGLLKD